MISSISIKELLNLEHPNIIDIRSIQSFNNNHIDKSINIPFEKIISNPSNFLEFDKKYFIYCQKGITSKKTCEMLNKLGYNTVNILGGYEEWILQKD